MLPDVHARLGTPIWVRWRPPSPPRGPQWRRTTSWPRARSSGLVLRLWSVQGVPILKAKMYWTTFVIIFFPYGQSGLDSFCVQFIFRIRYCTVRDFNTTQLGSFDWYWPEGNKIIQVALDLLALLIIVPSNFVLSHKSLLEKVLHVKRQLVFM
jgi:hypothetical protein